MKENPFDWVERKTLFGHASKRIFWLIKQTSDRRDKKISLEPTFGEAQICLPVSK